MMKNIITLKTEDENIDIQFSNGQIILNEKIKILYQGETSITKSGLNLSTDHEIRIISLNSEEKKQITKIPIGRNSRKKVISSILETQLKSKHTIFTKNNNSFVRFLPNNIANNFTYVDKHFINSESHWIDENGNIKKICLFELSIIKNSVYFSVTLGNIHGSDDFRYLKTERDLLFNKLMFSVPRKCFLKESPHSAPKIDAIWTKVINSRIIANIKKYQTAEQFIFDFNNKFKRIEKNYINPLTTILK